MFSIQNANNEKLTFTHLPNFKWTLTYPQIDVLEEGELIKVTTTNPNVIRAIQLYIDKKVYCNPSEEVLFTRRLQEKDGVFLSELRDIAEKIYCEHLYLLCTRLIDMECVTNKIQQIQIK
jgi:hypothetical protein